MQSRPSSAQTSHAAERRSGKHRVLWEKINSSDMALVFTFQLLLMLLISCHHATASNCSDPTVPINGFINKTEGAVIFFGCDPGFVPEGLTRAVCEPDGRWNPDPATLVCTLPPLPWHIGLIVLGVLALLLSIVALLMGMLSMCGFYRCCWTIVISLLFTSVIGIPIAFLIIHNFKNKARQYEQGSNSVNYSRRATYNRQARCYYGFYHGLSTVAYTFILNGLAWWIVLAVIASRPPDSRSSITRDVLLAFCFSIAALVFAVVAVSFIHPYRKYKSEYRDDRDDSGQMLMSHYGTTGSDYPEDAKIKDEDNYTKE